MALCTLTAIASCGGDARVKPLMGGVQATEKQSSDDDVAAVKADKTVKQNGGSAFGVEIPAPLTDRDELILKREGYTVSYNKKTLQPNWVAWRLTDDRISGSAKRPQRAFHEDEDAPEPRAADADYYNSGYDRGHMCPAADCKLNDEMMLQSFLFTNICPQSHGLNVGDWNEMENQCRRWAKRYGEIYIVCGPVFYKQKHKTIGKHKIPVPEAFFKVVLRTGDNPQAIGFIYKNEDGNRPKGDYVNSVRQVQRLTGIDFFPALDDEVEESVESSVNMQEWDIQR